MDILTSVPVRTAPITAILEDIEEMRRRINQRAHELFVGRGMADGRDLDDWFQAERELLTRCETRTWIAGPDVMAEIVLPPDEFPNLAVYVGFTQLVIASDPASNGRRIHHMIDLPEKIATHGVDAEQVGRTLQFAAALAQAE